MVVVMEVARKSAWRPSRRLQRRGGKVDAAAKERLHSEPSECRVRSSHGDRGQSGWI